MLYSFDFQAQACVIIYMSADFDFPDKNPLGIMFAFECLVGALYSSCCNVEL